MVEAKNIDIKKLEVNKGQIEGLPKNPRFIRDDRYEALKKSISDAPEMLSLRELIVYPFNGKYVICGGNMRFRACKDLGHKEIPCKVLDADTPVEKLREYTIKDNNGFGQDDFDLLANEWDVDELTDWGTELPDFDVDDVETEEEAKEDDFDEDKDEIETRCKTGDLWQLGEHRLMCGDSTKPDDVKKLMNGELADMVFTDPPYDLEDIMFFGSIRESTKEDCHIFCMSSDKHVLRIASENIDIFKKFFAVDFRCAHIISNNQPMTRVDLIAEFNKGKNRFVNTKDGFTTLIECAKIHSDKAEVNFGHKQAKRVELPAKFIEHYSNQTDIVLDLFGGSGTTLIACEQMNRKCVMMEYNEHYADIIIARWEKLTGNKAKKIS